MDPKIENQPVNFGNHCSSVLVTETEEKKIKIHIYYIVCTVFLQYNVFSCIEISASNLKYWKKQNTAPEGTTYFISRVRMSQIKTNKTIYYNKYYKT